MLEPRRSITPPSWNSLEFKRPTIPATVFQKLNSHLMSEANPSDCPSPGFAKKTGEALTPGWSIGNNTWWNLQKWPRAEYALTANTTSLKTSIWSPPGETPLPPTRPTTQQQTPLPPTRPTTQQQTPLPPTRPTSGVVTSTTDESGSTRNEEVPMLND